MTWRTWSNSSSETCLSLSSQAKWARPSSTYTSVRAFPVCYELMCTNTTCSTFKSLTLSIVLSFYPDVPKEQRLQAVQAAIMLMADENREVLQTLLCFLNDVTSSVEENQMTPMNLAVCLAPSLFHLNIMKNDNLSPR